MEVARGRDLGLFTPNYDIDPAEGRGIPRLAPRGASPAHAGRGLLFRHLPLHRRGSAEAVSASGAHARLYELSQRRARRGGEEPSAERGGHDGPSPRAGAEPPRRDHAGGRPRRITRPRRRARPGGLSPALRYRRKRASPASTPGCAGSTWTPPRKYRACCRLGATSR